jgi:cAMP phosphodiesterase
MQVRIIGGHGGSAPGFKNTSYLVDGKLLIDAGSVASGLQVDDQVLIDYILISHPHLDHISDIAFLCDNCFGQKGKPFELYSNGIVNKAIKDHLFNDIIWPDFSHLPNKENPTITFNDIEPEAELVLGDYKILPIKVNHPSEALGFIVEVNNSAVLFTQDTGPTDRIWEVAHNYKNLKAIFTEVSFPNSLQNVADASFHHTPQTMEEEIKKMPKDIPIFLGHLKPAFQAVLYQEIEKLSESKRVTLLGSDNTSYVFGN